jgi:phenylpyruvate tautomerase PptA (4-oxalocrotonate tautomerase family)
MIIKPGEKGQALILITLAAVGLFAFAALAIDSSRAYSNKRHAQNAADTAALAGALAYARGNDIQQAALDRAITNGYKNVTGDPSTVVTVVVTDVPEEDYCPGDATGKDITVTIESHLNTTFAKILGRNTMASGATATARSCGFILAPMFNGDAIVGLNSSNSYCGIDTGNSGAKKWKTTGGGVFSNGCMEHVNGTLTIPNDKCLTAVGNSTVTGGGTYGCVQEFQTDLLYEPSEIAALMPPNPCTGTITGGRYAGGGKVPTSGQHTFDNDIFCITDMVSFFGSPFHGDIVLNNSTLYVTDQNFDMKFNGGGDITGTATTTDGSPYKNFFMVVAMAPVTQSGCQQTFTMRGNGDGDLVGTVLAPTACFNASGNSGTGANRSQFIFYMVSTGGGGNAGIDVEYNAGENHQIPFSPTISILE